MVSYSITIHSTRAYITAAGTWINDARSWASSPEEAAVLEFNARNQVTLWGPNGEIIDYAAKVGVSCLRLYFIFI